MDVRGGGGLTGRGTGIHCNQGDGTVHVTNGKLFRARCVHVQAVRMTSINNGEQSICLHLSSIGTSQSEQSIQRNSRSTSNGSSRRRNCHRVAGGRGRACTASQLSFLRVGCCVASSTSQLEANVSGAALAVSRRDFGGGGGCSIGEESSSLGEGGALCCFVGAWLRLNALQPLLAQSLCGGGQGSQSIGDTSDLSNGGVVSGGGGGSSH